MQVSELVTETGYLSSYISVCLKYLKRLKILNWKDETHCELTLSKISAAFYLIITNTSFETNNKETNQCFLTVMRTSVKNAINSPFSWRLSFRKQIPTKVRNASLTTGNTTVKCILWNAERPVIDVIKMNHCCKPSRKMSDCSNVQLNQN